MATVSFSVSDEFKAAVDEFVTLRQDQDDSLSVAEVLRIAFAPIVGYDYDAELDAKDALKANKEQVKSVVKSVQASILEAIKAGKSLEEISKSLGVSMVA